MGFTKRYRRALDATGPFRGPCGICGAHPDARHRMVDSIRSQFKGGDSPESLVRWFGYTEEAIATILEGVKGPK